MTDPTHPPAEPRAESVDVEAIEARWKECAALHVHHDRLCFVRLDVGLLIAEVRAERARAQAAEQLREVVTEAIADHDDIADTEGSAMAGPEEGRPATGWRCGCKWCVKAKAALSAPGHQGEEGK